jgi:hypothetical protein
VALLHLGTTGRIHSHDNLPHNICTLSTLDFTHTWGQIQAKTFRSNPTPMHRLFCMSSLKWSENIILRFNVKMSIMKLLRSHFRSQVWTDVDAQEVGIFLHTISLFKYYSKSISAFLNIFGYLLRWGTL